MDAGMLGGETTCRRSPADHFQTTDDHLFTGGTRVKLNPGVTLNAGDIFFPLDAVVALSMSREQARFQVGLAGKGDVVGIHRLLLPGFPVLMARVLSGGSAVRVPADAVFRASKADPALHERLLGYAFRSTAGFLAETALQAALMIEQKVARWIALYRDAVQRDDLAITHRELAELLGVRRSGVTVALHVLEGERIIRSRRGRLQVLDRDRLHMTGRCNEAVSRGNSTRVARPETAHVQA
jgi:CRP-like cAMP-binding protein